MFLKCQLIYFLWLWFFVHHVFAPKLSFLRPTRKRNLPITIMLPKMTIIQTMPKGTSDPMTFGSWKSMLSRGLVQFSTHIVTSSLTSEVVLRSRSMSRPCSGSGVTPPTFRRTATVLLLLMPFSSLIACCTRFECADHLVFSGLFSSWLTCNVRNTVLEHYCFMELKWALKPAGISGIRSFKLQIRCIWDFTKNLLRLVSSLYGD